MRSIRQPASRWTWRRRTGCSEGCSRMRRSVQEIPVQAMFKESLTETQTTWSEVGGLTRPLCAIRWLNLHVKHYSKRHYWCKFKNTEFGWEIFGRNICDNWIFKISINGSNCIYHIIEFRTFFRTFLAWAVRQRVMCLHSRSPDSKLGFDTLQLRHINRQVRLLPSPSWPQLRPPSKMYHLNFLIVCCSYMSLFSRTICLVLKDYTLFEH
jgi:hypothetical protein